MKLLSILLAAIMLITLPTYAEIQYVKIKWNNQLCQYTCNQMLYRKLNEIRQVSRVEYDSQFGEAVLTWKPNVPFSFEPINSAMRLVGPALLATNIKIRGTIVKSGSSYYIKSIGDNTRFKLLGELQYKKNMQVIQYSEYTHPLTHENINQLEEAIKNHSIVAIEGILFEPEWMTLRVIILNLKFEEEKKERPLYR